MNQNKISDIINDSPTTLGFLVLHDNLHRCQPLPIVVIHGCDIRYITVKEYQNFRKVTDYKREQCNGDLILQRYSMNFLKQISRQYFRFRANSKWLHEYM